MRRIRLRTLMILVALVALVMGTATYTESIGGSIQVRNLAWGPVNLQWSHYDDPGYHVVGVVWYRRSGELAP